MPKNRSGLKVLDLYCGAGGFSEGFRQAGFDVVMGIDNWQTALDSHSQNGLGASLNYDMLKLVDEGGYKQAKRLAKEIQDTHGRIDVLIGSPPCTEFSYAKKGGKGDIEKGMLLVRAHLVMVAAIQPKFWLMENVPRLKKAIDKESTRENSHGWYVDTERLGVNEDLSDSDLFDTKSLIIPYGAIYTASDYGAPQGRKRFIAGNLNPVVVAKQKTNEIHTMRHIIEGLRKATSGKNELVRDPNYPHHSIKRDFLKDYFYDAKLHPMYWEELRHLKRRHIQYGRMSFPDELDRPARTIMATSNPSSREAVTLDTGETMLYQRKERPLLKQPTVREVACIQGFPISFQFTGKSLSTRYKQIGNAVPCQLSRALALSIVEEFKKTQTENIEQARRLELTISRLNRSKQKPIIKKPRKYLDEAKDSGQNKYMEFRARPNKHIRRKLLSAKPWNTSAMLIFENTDWSNQGKRIGGFWKSCIQLGQGKQFSQVYLDETSVGTILNNVESQFGIIQSKEGQTTLGIYDKNLILSDEKEERVKRINDLRNLLKEIFDTIDNGIPVVPQEWKEFPGYKSDDTKKYLQMQPIRRLKIPSHEKFQEMFTSEEPETKDEIGPIDIFDGLDFVMLHQLTQSSRAWMHNISIEFNNLSDCGEILHKHRISKVAENLIMGKVPLITIIGALVSVHVLNTMHSKDKIKKSPLTLSLSSAWRLITHWINN